MWIITFLLACALQPQAQAEGWAWGGDLRLRTQLEKTDGTDSRLRERIRVRLGVKAEVNETIKAEIRLASSTDQRNEDQTLGDNSAPGSKRRNIGLDLAYADWTPADFFKLYGGRFPQIHYRPTGSQIIFDEEVALEGMAFAADYQLMESVRFSLNAGSVYIRENYDSFLSLDQTDNMLNWGQARGEWANNKFFAAAGFGFFNFVAVEGQNFSDLTPGGSPGGNSEGAAGVVKNPFLPKQYFIDLKFKPVIFEFGAFGEWIVNNETKDPNKAQRFGISAAHGTWDLSFAYLQINSDSVLSSFTDSDFANGRTDASGVTAALGWKFSRNMSARFTHSRSRYDAGGFEKNQQYSHLDVSAYF